MYCPQQLSYVIRKGDNLYQLAKYYHTTVPMILSINPGLDPYNLLIGRTIVICPGENFIMQSDNLNSTIYMDYSRQMALTNNMRMVWEQHVYWTRMLLISIAERLNDQNAVTNKILKNPYDIANIFANYYSTDIARSIASLLTEHLQIGANLITALRDKNTVQVDILNHQWYVNADKMADAFSRINPYYNREDLRKMLYSHLELTTKEVVMRLAGDYLEDIKAFDIVEQEALAMADHFTFGLMKQFPQKFN